MTMGIGSGLREAGTLLGLLDLCGHEAARRILTPEGANSPLSSPSAPLAEKTAGCHGIGEAVSKAVGSGLRVWGLRGLRKEKVKATAAGKLGEKVDGLGTSKVHAIVGHVCGIPVAIVMLESRNQI